MFLPGDAALDGYMLDKERAKAASDRFRVANSIRGYKPRHGDAEISDRWIAGVVANAKGFFAAGEA